jgi:hypothetical protein
MSVTWRHDMRKIVALALAVIIGLNLECQSESVISNAPNFGKLECSQKFTRARHDGASAEPLLSYHSSEAKFLKPLRLRGGSSPNSNFEEVGKAFVMHYYNIFDTNRAGLQSLYQDMSMMTFEGEKIQGAQAITQKLTSLPFQTVKHEVITADSQPTASGGVMVFVCGNLKVVKCCNHLNQASCSKLMLRLYRLTDLRIP